MHVGHERLSERPERDDPSGLFRAEAVQGRDIDVADECWDGCSGRLPDERHQDQGDHRSHDVTPRFERRVRS